MKMKMMTSLSIRNSVLLKFIDMIPRSTSSCPPSSAKAAGKIAEPTNSQHTIALVLAVRNTRSLGTFLLNCRQVTASEKPPKAPAAASVGVARPVTIEPSTAKISISNGKKLKCSILKIFSRWKLRIA